MNKIVGIDLGTTNSAIAMVDSGIPLVIADRAGERLTPSVVYFPEAPAEPVVGNQAHRARALHPRETVSSVKRFMGRRAGEIAEEEKGVPYKLAGDRSGPVVIELPGRSLRPEQVSAEILKKLKRDAEEFLGESIGRAVITVPAYFNDAQRSATKQAGELAGLTVERIVNEPTAAALAYGLDKLRERSKIAVYDLGGGTFDLSILELNEGVFQVLATSGDTRLGGDDLDQRVVGWLLEQIHAAGEVDLRGDPKAMARIREEAERAKIRLSTDTEVEIALPFLRPDLSLRVGLTRARLEKLTHDIIQQTRTHCVRALSDAKLEPADLDQVILVGGQTRMPLVRQLVRETFHCADFEAIAGAIRVGDQFHRSAGPMLNTTQNPEEAVALGAAIQAEILSGGFKNVLLLDVTPLSLGVETFGGLMNVIIPRNSTIPIKAGEVFTTAVDHQTSMLIHVLQGERERARDNWSLGRFILPFQSAPKGVARVGVQFEIDANGILRVLARDLGSGHEQVLELKSAVDVHDAEVQQMVEASVEHAFEDLRSRQWVEVKIRAEETIALAWRGLAECPNDLGVESRARIESAIGAVKEALSTEQPDSSTGELDRLKSALAALDRATQPLAELMMEKVLEAMLRKGGTFPS